MIYQLECYKAILRLCLDSRKKQISKSYNYQNLAKAMRVQKTYLSKVLLHDAHLNEDQLFLASEYLGLNEAEGEYFRLVHGMQRTTIERKRKSLQLQMRQLRDKQLSTTEHLSAKKTEKSADMSRYFLNFRLQLMHMAMTIDAFCHDPRKLREALHMSSDELLVNYQELEQLGLISFNGTRFEVVEDSLHLDQKSPIFPAYRSLTRFKALQQLENLKPEDCYNFSVLFSSEPKVFIEIRQRFLQFLEGIEGLVKDQKSEEVYQMSFDLFPWVKQG